jgi:hypothetical protein
MTPLLAAHIVSGSLAILSGFVALYATKGMTLHRRAGLLFVVVMLVLTSTGATIAALEGAAPALNIPAAALTAYLVLTGFTTVRPPSNRVVARTLHVYLLVAGLAIAAFCLLLVVRPHLFIWERKGAPSFPYWLFGIVGTLAVLGDLKMAFAGFTVTGAPRLARHLWRMSTALGIAVMSFFIGQADVFPPQLRIMPLLATPMLAVLATMLYWMWRVRLRGSLRGVFAPAARVPAPMPASVPAPAADSR